MRDTWEGPFSSPWCRNPRPLTLRIWNISRKLRGPLLPCITMKSERLAERFLTLTLTRSPSNTSFAQRSKRETQVRAVLISSEQDLERRINAFQQYLWPHELQLWFPLVKWPTFPLCLAPYVYSFISVSSLTNPVCECKCYSSRHDDIDDDDDET